MDWKIRFDPRAPKDLADLDPSVRRRVVAFLEERVATVADPKCLGKALIGEFAGVWRYRVGDYRILCRVEHTEWVILVVAVGHRKDVYD